MLPYANKTSFAVLLLSLLLAACGGGADGDQTPLPVCSDNEIVLENGWCGPVPVVQCELPEVAVDGRCIVPDKPVPSESSASSPSTPSHEEHVVATTMTTANFVSERVCLDQKGPHVLEVEAASGNAAIGFLTLDDGSTEGEYVTSAMRFARQPRQIRSEEIVLHAGEPCYLVSAETGIIGYRATTRLIRLDGHGVPDESRQPGVSSEPAGIVCDRFELRWELDGQDLLLAIDSDLPDEGGLSVSVSRSYKVVPTAVGNDEEYSRDYLSVSEPVSRWREPRRISLDAGAWRANLDAHLGRLAEIAEAERQAGLLLPAADRVAYELASIADEVEIRAVLHLNQDDPRFGGWGNPNLSGAATTLWSLGNGVIVEAETSFEFPLE